MKRPGRRACGDGAGLCPFRGAEWIETEFGAQRIEHLAGLCPFRGAEWIETSKAQVQRVRPRLCPFRGAEWIETPDD